MPRHSLRAAPRRAAGAALVAVALVGLAPAVAGATEPVSRERLEAIERALDAERERGRTLGRRVGEIDRDIAALRRGLVEAAAAAQAQEDKISAIEARLAGLDREERAKTAALARRRGELAAVLGALARLSRRPPALLIAAPRSVLESARGAMLLSRTAPELEARGRVLAAEIAALGDLRAEIEAERARLGDAREVLRKERAVLNLLLARKAKLRDRSLAARGEALRRLDRLAREATDLRALLARLEDEARRPASRATLAKPPEPAPEKRAAAPERRPAPPPAERSFSSARGQLPLPARGRVVGRFGARDELGVPAKGITIATRPEAEVVAPFDGKIVFAGPFRGYGQLLIIAHSEGYHTLLAGFSRIYGVVGQWVLAGEPVGRMGHGRGRAPTLYVELRRGGTPINPIPWLAASERKVSG